MESQYWIPTVTRLGQTMDIYSSMMARGIIFINAPIDQRIAGLINTSLLHIHETADIVQPRLYLNTKRGDVISAMSVVDVMRFLKVPIETVGFGEIGVAAALILAAGTKGHRRAAAHCNLGLRIGIDNLAFEAVQSEQAKAAEQAKVLKKAMDLFAQFTKQNINTIRTLTNSESYIDAEEAKELGFIDEIV